MGGLPKGVPHNYPEGRVVSLAVIEGLDKAREASNESRKERMLERQIEFLSYFGEHGIKESAEKVGVTTWAVANWVMESQEFREKYNKIKETRDLWLQEDEEDYLHNIGTGVEKANMPQVVAAKMCLTARNPKRWSDKLQQESRKTIEITRIEYSLTSGRSVEVIDVPVKELPSG